MRRTVGDCVSSGPGHFQDGRLAFLHRIIPKDRRDAQRFLFLNQARQVVADDLAQYLVDIATGVLLRT